MQFIPTKFDAAWLLRIQPHPDMRGFFARTWCEEEFRHHGLCDRFVQCSVSFNEHEGTVRGMHLQMAPAEEVKIVRCTRGAIFDVIVDCRPGSATFGTWEAFYLNEDNHDAVYVPKGFAHGFQALATRTEVFYHISQFHDPECARSFHYLDKDIGISWPKPVSVVSPKDKKAMAFATCSAEFQE